MARQLRGFERVPVMGTDGRTDLGVCEVRKFARSAGCPRKEIRVFDRFGELAADITVYRRHSRICCGKYDGQTVLIDTTLAVAVARAALEAGGDPVAALAAVIAAANGLSR